jgi:malate dehydrogenase (quinone)
MFQKEKVLAVSVSGQWLKINPDVIAKHQSKVYGKASVAPPMSVPHIDSRMINGENSCYLALCWFFNPILKNGSYSDLPLSIKPDNIFPMLSAGIKNIPLTKYLIQQVRQSPKDN